MGDCTLEIGSNCGGEWSIEGVHPGAGVYSIYRCMINCYIIVTFELLAEADVGGIISPPPFLFG